MKYISTRGGGEPQEFCDILLGGLAPDGGLYLPESYPQVTPPNSPNGAAVLPRAGVRDPELFIDDIPAGDLKASVDRTYTAQTYRWSRDPAKARHHAADHAGTRFAPAGTVQRADAGLQGHGHAAARQPVRVRAGSAARPSTSSARPRATPVRRPSTRCAASAASASSCCRPRQDERLPARADVLPAGREHFQHRRARHVRRLPGHRQGRVQRRSHSRRSTASAR
jgi:hypothetical protein